MQESQKTMELLWPDADRPKRGPKPRLTLARIVQTAIEVADSEGLGSVSMQRIADDLGTTKMALYRYTPGKTELTAVMLDTAIGGPPELPHSQHEWRLALTEWAAAMSAAFGRHPWGRELAVGARVLGPNELDWMETGLRALSGTALTRAERLDALALIVGHVRNISEQSIRSDGTTERTEHGVDVLMAEVLDAHEERYPEVAATFSEARASSGQDNAFAFGLERILDGLEMAIQRRP